MGIGIITATEPGLSRLHLAPAVQLRGVSRLFGTGPALARVDFQVDRGETVLISGPNGAGKTTLLKIIATLLAPTRGGGRVMGHDLAQRQAIRRKSEYLGHRTRLYEDLTAAENLRFAAVLFEADACGVPEVLDRVGLLGVTGEPVRGFSQGMRQRLALARILLRAPDLILLDEPYAGLDADARSLVDDLIVEARGRGATSILVTHDTTRSSVATRAVVMRGGRLLTGR